ncbi:MAG: arginine decarboxylase, pyruvoyl-dependent [Candidatus Aminicenantes bacterium]
MPNTLLPNKMFFTKGVGHHRNKLQSFEVALRSAGIEKFNLVTISSIFPPDCKIISKAQGLNTLQPGQVIFVVMARESTNEPNRLIAASIGLAQPFDRKQYGYLSEHHEFGQTMKKAKDFAEDLAATMLASTMGIELDPDSDWDERKNLYITDQNRKFTSRSVAQSAQGHKDGLWTTVLACAVMLINKSDML